MAEPIREGEEEEGIPPKNRHSLFSFNFFLRRLKLHLLAGWKMTKY